MHVDQLCVGNPSRVESRCCVILLAAYETIGKRFPPGADHPSDLEVVLLQHELMTALGDATFLYVGAAGAGVTLRRILTGPFVVGRNSDELWRYAKS